MLGQYSGGRIADRFDPRIGYLFFFGITAPAAFFMAYAGNYLLVGLALLYFFFLLGMQPMENTLVAKYTPRRFHHSAFGTKFILTFGIGALGVKIAAAIESNYHIEAVFYFIAATTVAAIAVLFLLIVRTQTRPLTENLKSSLTQPSGS
jgi:MFS family permease